MNKEQYRQRFKEGESAPGWDAIDEVARRVYGDQEPRHLAATPHCSLGGKDPIDGISLYDAEYKGVSYVHFVTYGFSSLYYDEDSVGADFSRFGFELTCRVVPLPEETDGPLWVASMIQNIARYVFKANTWFEPNHNLDAKGPLRANTDTKLEGLAFPEDPEFGTIDTVHGRVQFLQMFGLTRKELERIAAGATTAEILDVHREHNPMLVVDVLRDELE